MNGPTMIILIGTTATGEQKPVLVDDDGKLIVG